MKELTPEIIQQASEKAVKNSEDVIKQMPNKWILTNMVRCNESDKASFKKSKKEIERLRKLLQKGERK